MARILLLYLPSFVGLIWDALPRFSIAWSVAGSFFIAIITQTRWFREPDDDIPVTQRLLRPISVYQFYFLGFQVVGSAFYALNAAGYNFHGQVAMPQESKLELIAQLQSYMLLAHASVMAGMKLVGFKYGKPRYVIPALPPYGLILISFISLGAGTVATMISPLYNLGLKLFDLSLTAILVETWLSVRRGHFTNQALTLSVLGFNLFGQILSGWKGLVLWSAITLGGMFFPLMPKRVIVVGTAFFLFWVLFLHPFGQLYRPLTWYYEIKPEIAIEMAKEYALNLTMEERLDNLWETMIDRVNDMWQFEKYVQHVPDRRPYYGFDLIQEAMIALVPRILWPEKPDLERVAMQRVYEAGVVSENTPVSAKTSFYIDGYLSGGWLAMALASLGYGVVAVFVSRACERLFGGYDIGTCFIYVGLFTFWINSGPNFLFFVGAIWTSFVTMFGLFVAGRGAGWIVPARPAQAAPA
ncbi:MAG: hypothetical protein HYV04_19580, partial [Deltaproteobacteria bacterium]|nr:hypothetical protein [Deltaproteobacteria bacterium]